MCLAIPAEVVQKLDNERAIVAVGGVKKEVSIALIDDVKEGDFLIIHVGYALNKLDADEAKKTLEYFKEVDNETH